MNSAGEPVGAVERLGVWCYRRRWRVVAVAVCLLASFSAVAAAAGDEFRQSFALPGSEAQEAADLLAGAGLEGLGGQRGTLVVAADDAQAPGVRQPVAELLRRIDRDVEGVTVTSPYAEQSAHQIAMDGSLAFATLDFGEVSLSEATARAAGVARVLNETTMPTGVDVELGGELFIEAEEFSSEGLGLLAAAVILLIAFGSVLAMGLPIATALAGIGCGVAVVGLATRFIDIPPFTPGVVAMIGIGAGIDYALFIVTRYREERADGLGNEQAVLRAMGTAGRSTVFAGGTVVTSLLGLLVIGLDDVRSLALAAAAGVLFVMLASVTLLPALLGFAGDNIDRLGLPHRHRLGTRRVERSLWYRWSRLLQRRPVPVAVSALLVLLVLAAPVMSLRLGVADASNRPETDTTRRAYDLLADGFGPGVNGPLFLAVSLRQAADPDDTLQRLATGLHSDPGIDRVLAPISNNAGNVAVVQVIPSSAPQDPETTALVHRIRARAIPGALGGTGADALVGGAAAATVDFAAHNAATLPWFVTAVLLLAFLLLVVIFRSVVVPIKAVIVNLLSVGAAYGVVVAVFQWGWLGESLGLGQPGPVEAWVPMMLFAIVFGLSMDYEVFLLSRIREQFDRTGDNATAVADGLARTARLITAAAAIMVCVFGAFVLSGERALQMMGLGLAVAIGVDATLVRLVLVPATMELLGDRNWWLPSWLAARLRRPSTVDARQDVAVG